MEQELERHDFPCHTLSVTTLSGTSTGYFHSNDTLQEVINWVVRKQKLIINGPMVLSYKDRALNPAHTIEQEQLPQDAKLTYLAVVGGGGEQRI
jgi:hypothetical protein